jgi:hypothetical protein
MLRTKIVLNVKTKTSIFVHNMFCRYSELTIFMNNEQSVIILTCGLVDAKIRASDKELPVHKDRHARELLHLRNLELDRRSML